MVNKNELLLEINNTLPVEILIKIFSFCNFDKKKLLAPIIITKCISSVPKFCIYTLTLLFFGYIICYWIYLFLICSKENR